MITPAVTNNADFEDGIIESAVSHTAHIVTQSMGRSFLPLDFLFAFYLFFLFILMKRIEKLVPSSLYAVRIQYFKLNVSFGVVFYK